jgi:hypothetical protein
MTGADLDWEEELHKLVRLERILGYQSADQKAKPPLLVSPFFKRRRIDVSRMIDASYTIRRRRRPRLHQNCCSPAFEEHGFAEEAF